MDLNGVGGGAPPMLVKLLKLTGEINENLHLLKIRVNFEIILLLRCEF